MTRRFEYRVCYLQNSRVTYVNDEWQGSVLPTAVDPDAALKSCPMVWDYLRLAGLDGWELTGTLSQTADSGKALQVLFLKREPGP